MDLKPHSSKEISNLYLPSQKRLSVLRIFLRFLGLTLLPLLLVLLTTASIPSFQTVNAQTTWQTLYQDDFEDGTAGCWNLDAGWEVDLDGTNHVLSGTGHTTSSLLTGANWTDYRFSLKVKLILEGVHINVRQNGTNRYFIRLFETGLTLNKQVNEQFPVLAEVQESVSVGVWHDVAITVEGSAITVSVDGIEKMNYTDSDSPLLQGSVSLETVDGAEAHVHFDDVLIEGEPLTVTAPPSISADWVPLYEDNFDTLAEGWNLGSGWEPEQESDNWVLSGEGHNWATPDVDGWVNCIIQARIKIFSAGFHFNFRKSEQRISPTELIPCRYLLGITESMLYLSKQRGDDNYYALYSGSNCLTRGVWHDVRIDLEGSSIMVYLDDALAFEVTDDDQPLLFGTFAFETLDNTHMHFDNIVVSGQTPPSAPSGYTWTKTGGPAGGLGYDIRIHPGERKVMYVTDNPSGVNKSIDAGATWIKKNVGITTRTGPSMDGIPVFSLTIDPNNNDIVWAGTQNAKGIYLTTDGGETWTKKDNGVTESDTISFRGFGIYPTNSNIVFAGAEISTGILGKEFDRTNGKIYKSTDRGENWHAVWEGGNLARFVLFDFTNPDIMYASTGIFDREAYADTRPGILKSTNGGETWTEINNGIPDTGGNRFLGFLEMDPTNPKRLFAASGNNAAGYGGVFRTLDGGENWEMVLTGDDIFTVVVISPSNPNVVYVGGTQAFWRSDDGGTTWQKFQKADEGCWGPPGVRPGFPIGGVVDPQNSNIIFANNYGGGNFKSSDGGKTWTNSSNGYTGANLQDIAVNASEPSTVYAIGQSGPWRSDDGGMNWNGIAYSPASFGVWNAVTLNPQNPEEVIVADQHQGVILKSTDKGNSWTLVFRQPDVDASDITKRHGFRDIAYAPSNPSIVYGGMRREARAIDGDITPGPSYGMYKSTQGGKEGTWVEINNGLNTSYININCVAVHPTNPDIVYIGTWMDGIFKTTDGGQNWVLKSNGLTSADCRSLAIDPKNPDTVYAGLGGGAGVFKTINGGEQWSSINTGLSIVCPSGLLPVGKVNLGISFEKSPRRVVGSDYYSVPWTSVWAIVVDPVNSQNVYAGDHQSGAYFSTNGGMNWVPINEGLSTKAITAMTISADGKVVYTATEGEGVFRIGNVQSGCSAWDDVITKYSKYVNGEAGWSDVITCYQSYASS